MKPCAIQSCERHNNGGSLCNGHRMGVIECQDEAEWTETRRNGIGASDVPTILGVTEPGSPWFKTPHELWSEKVGEAERKPADPAVEEYRYWGHRIEPIVAEEYAVRTGRAVKDLGRFTIQRHPDYPFICATLDRIANHEEHGWGPINAKTVGFSQRSKWIVARTGERKTPIDYQVQIQIEAFVYGAKWAGLAALIGGNTFEHREFPYDPDFIKAALPVLVRFWKHVTDKEPLPEGWPK